MRLCKISNHSIRKTLNLRAVMLAMAVLLAKFLWERPTSIGENPIHRYTNVVSDPSLLTQTWNQSLRERELKRFPDFKALNPDFKPAEGPKVILFWTDWEKKLSWEQRYAILVSLDIGVVVALVITDGIIMMIILVVMIN